MRDVTAVSLAYALFNSGFNRFTGGNYMYNCNNWQYSAL